MQDFEARFGGIQRLYGAPAMARLRRAHLCVIGIGGVGSWAAEALARSGVGTLTLVDLDEVCVSNVNRQLPALEGAIGRPKVDVMAERVRAIHPACEVRPVQEFFTADSADRLLAIQFDFVIDAIDRPSQKAMLIAGCRARGIPVITAGAAGGRRDPTRVQVADLAESHHDALLQEVRRLLRRHHGFPRGAKSFDVPCVFSPEPVVLPRPDGTVCVGSPPEPDTRLNCDSGYGTASFVTGTFGFVAAGYVIRGLVEE